MTEEEAIRKIVRLAGIIGPFSPVTNALDKAVGALREQVKESPRWISVKDKLPEDERGVLAYYGFDRGDGDLGMRFMQVLTYFAFDPRPRWQCESTGLSVTHWMPLPQAPKEKQ